MILARPGSARLARHRQQARCRYIVTLSLRQGRGDRTGGKWCAASSAASCALASPAPRTAPRRRAARPQSPGWRAGSPLGVQDDHALAHGIEGCRRALALDSGEGPVAGWSGGHPADAANAAAAGGPPARPTTSGQHEASTSASWIASIAAENSSNDGLAARTLSCYPAYDGPAGYGFPAKCQSRPWNQQKT